MKPIILIFGLALALNAPALAVNADSLGSNPWTSYLRSDVADTVVGNLYMPAGATIGEWGGGEFKTPFCTELSVHNL
ncbi:MAG: hypothetical protein Q8O74_08570, partial [bacterium]|nr:hypothetical protein [bacterium]